MIIRIGALIFVLTVGVAWAVIGAIPLLAVCLIKPKRAEDALWVWLWPVEKAAEWFERSD